MVRYNCKCQKCGSRLVSKATWYRHNKERVRHHPYTAGTSAGTGNRHVAPGTLSIPPSDIYVKDLSPEDIDLEGKVKRAARSDSVGVIC